MQSNDWPLTLQSINAIQILLVIHWIVLHWAIYRSKYKILLCSIPPAVHVTLYNPNKTVIFNRTITNSTGMGLPLNSKFVIIVYHNKPDAIGLKVSRSSIMRP